MNPALQGYVAAVLDALEPRSIKTVAKDLRAVEQLFISNADLRNALTDVAVPALARRQVMADLLAKKVDPSAARLCAYAASAVHAQDIPSALLWLSIRAEAIAEGREGDEEILAYSQARLRVGGFAAAVFEETATKELETVEKEIFTFARAVAESQELRAVLSNRDLPVKLRQSVVSDLLGKKVNAVTLRLVHYAVAGGRPRDIVGTLDWLVERIAEARGWRVARVHAGQEISAAQKKKLESTLATITGAPVELQVRVDPALLAGIRVDIGDLRLDATAKGRLERLREHVVAGGWQDQGFGRLEAGVHHDQTSATANSAKGAK